MNQHNGSNFSGNRHIPEKIGVSLQSKRGFTLIELLVVIAIIGILASVVLGGLNGARAKARDSERVQTLRAFKTALELYYADYGRYPDPEPLEGTASTLYDFSYHKFNAGVCDLNDWYEDSSGNPPDSLNIDNSASPGFISELFNGGYISSLNWHDPNNSSVNNDIFNCRYVAPQSQLGNIQKYLLHCNLESNTTLEANDGGLNNTVYEVMMPDPWICICGQDGMIGATVLPMAPGSCRN